MCVRTFGSLLQISQGGCQQKQLCFPFTLLTNVDTFLWLLSYVTCFSPVLRLWVFAEAKKPNKQNNMHKIFWLLIELNNEKVPLEPHELKTHVFRWMVLWSAGLCTRLFVRVGHRALATVPSDSPSSCRLVSFSLPAGQREMCTCAPASFRVLRSPFSPTNTKQMDRHT